jgi:ParB-like chromosome segregation protein Spo0J
MTGLSFAHTRGCFGITKGGGPPGPPTIKRGIIVKDRKTKEGLLSRQDLLEATHLSPQALTIYEEAGYVSEAKVSDGVKYYSEETVGIIKAMEQCLGRCANLQEAHEIALRGMASKKRRGNEADSSQLQTIDPKKIKTHPRFQGLLTIDEDLAEDLSADMTVEGYYRSIPIVLATWPGQKEPVLIDGHTRVPAAIKAGVPKIPYVVETFDDIDGALEYIAKVQTHRRPTDDWVRYQLITELDRPLERGGDRRSEQAKSNTPAGGLETPRKTSAERTADLVGCSARTVERARRIRKDGTPEILEALRNREMTISQAENAIIKKAQAEAEKNTGEQSSDAESENSLVHVTDEYRAVLSQMEGTLYEHVNKAVKMYIRWLRDKGRLPKE